MGQQLIVVDLDDERNAVGVLARHGTENPQRRGDRVALTLEGELDDVAWIEIHRIWCKRSAGRMLDALIHRQN